MEPTYEPKAVMQDEYGIDMNGHRATNIRNSQIEEMDLILCATNRHKREVIAIYQNIKKGLLFLCGYSKIQTDI